MSKRDVNGVLLLDKPHGFSSNAALQKVKYLFKAKKAGHTGTLDPLATGLLPICFGEATKFASYLLDSKKEYVATVKLGIATTTYDSEGEITASKPVNCQLEEVLHVLREFIGTIWQTPPKYSALKVNGRALYEYARNEEEVSIKSRQIAVYKIAITDHKLDESDMCSEVDLKILCSKGTYIRSIAHDLGQKLGCGAHLSKLIRTKTANFSLEQAVGCEELLSLDLDELDKLLLPADVLVQGLNKINLDEVQYNMIKHGQAFNNRADYALETVEGSVCKVAMYYREIFLGVGTITKEQVFPSRLIRMS